MLKVRCPICEKEMRGSSAAEWPEYPFCSQKCRLIDLGRWLNEDYRLPTKPEDDLSTEMGDDNYPP